MSDNALIQRAPMTGNAALALDNVTVLRETFHLMMELGQAGCVPTGMTAGEAMLCASIGQRFGWNALESCQRFHIVKGTVVMKADTMVGVAKSHPDCEYICVIESDAETATYETMRRGSPSAERVTFTMADAKTATLLNNSTWKRFPAQMLRARASSALVRMVYPDALAGIYTADEMGAPEVEMGDIFEARFTPAAQTQPARPAAQSAKPESAQATGRDDLKTYIANHEMACAIELYWNARASDGAAFQSIDQIDAWPHDQATAFHGILQRVLDAGPYGAATFLSQALGRTLEPGDMARLEARIEWAAQPGAVVEGWALAFAQALLAEKCVRSPEILHLRLGFEKPAKGGEA